MKDLRKMLSSLSILSSAVLELLSYLTPESENYSIAKCDIYQIGAPGNGCPRSIIIVSSAKTVHHHVWERNFILCFRKLYLLAFRNMENLKFCLSVLIYCRRAITQRFVLSPRYSIFSFICLPDIFSFLSASVR